MSKIICEVCGTSYPDTSPQCPICGYANPGNSQNLAGDSTEGETQNGYHYVKGGRFSKSNVRKRNQNHQIPVRNTTTEKVVRHAQHAATGAHQELPEQNGQEQRVFMNNEKKQKKPVGAIVATVVLLLAIIGVVVYLSLQFFGPDSKVVPHIPNDTTSALDVTSPSDSTAPTEKPTPVVIPCEDISLNITEVSFDTINSSRMLYPEVYPVDTTDNIVYVSSDDSVATVSDVGMITAVGNGEAVITVTCGQATATCKVVCVVQDLTAPSDESTEPTEAASEEPTQPASGALKLNRKDITFSSKDASWILYDGSIAKTEITWSSDNTSVAVFEGGTVKAVGAGTTKVHAEYNGEKVSCIIRCNFKDEAPSQGDDGGVSEDGNVPAPTTAPETATEPSTKPEEGNSAVTYSVTSPYGPASDITIPSGSSIQLTVKDNKGNAVNAVWKVVSGTGCTVSNGLVSGTGNSINTLTATTDDGKTLTCVVRVS